MEDDLDLDEQLAILGVDLGAGVTAKEPSTNVKVENVVPQPYTPENPTNTGVVTSNVVPQTGLGVAGVNTNGLTDELLNTQANVNDWNMTVSQSTNDIKGIVKNTDNYAQRQIQDTLQRQVNDEAAAQVVQPTTTSIPQPQSVTVSHPQVEKVEMPVASSSQPKEDELVFIDLAKAVNTQKTPWLRLKDNEWSRILIYDLSKVIPIKVHYIKGLGYVKCLSKFTPEGWLEQPCQCCKKLIQTANGYEWQPRLDENGNEIKAKNRYLVPVIEYPVDKSNANKLVPGQLPQLKMWNMNAVEWGDLRTAVQGIADDPDDLSTADLTNVDFLLNKDTTSRFKTISITPSPKCLRSNFKANIQAEMQKISNDFYMTALKESRKIVSEETILNAYIAQEAEAQTVNSVIESTSNMATQGLDI